MWAVGERYSPVNAVLLLVQRLFFFNQPLRPTLEVPLLQCLCRPIDACTMYTLKNNHNNGGIKRTRLGPFCREFPTFFPFHLTRSWRSVPSTPPHSSYDFSYLEENAWHGFFKNFIFYCQGIGLFQLIDHRLNRVPKRFVFNECNAKKRLSQWIR